MTRGRKRIPTAILKRRGSKWANTPERENEPQPPEGELEPPEFTTQARAKWDYYLPILEHMGVVGPAERDYLMQMCRSLALNDFCNQLIDNAVEMGDPSLLMVLGGAGPREHPVLGAQRKAWEQAEKIAAKLGLNPSDRSQAQKYNETAPKTSDINNIIRLKLKSAN